MQSNRERTEITQRREMVRLDDARRKSSNRGRSVRSERSAAAPIWGAAWVAPKGCRLFLMGCIQANACPEIKLLEAVRLGTSSGVSEHGAPLSPALDISDCTDHIGILGRYRCLHQAWLVYIKTLPTAHRLGAEHSCA